LANCTLNSQVWIRHPGMITLLIVCGIGLPINN
jgi:hypothetical protein